MSNLLIFLVQLIGITLGSMMLFMFLFWIMCFLLEIADCIKAWWSSK